MRDWAEAFRAWGWTACRPAGAPYMHVGVAHPGYGVVSLRVVETAAASLTRVATLAYIGGAVVPTLYVGASLFTDVARDGPHTALGVLSYRSDAVPLFLVRWNSQWLPYFEDDNDWVHTGWEMDGVVAPRFKPEGWDGTLLGGETEGTGSTHSAT